MLFALASGFVFTAIAYMMHKHISSIAIYASSLFSLVFQLSIDTILEFKYDLYGYFEHGVDYQTFLFMLLIYPSLTSIFLNYFPLQKRILGKVIYILGWTIFSLVYEILCLQFGAFYYREWSLWYSAILYPIIYILILWNYFLIRKITKS